MEGKGILMRLPAGVLLLCAALLGCAGMVSGGEPERPPRNARETARGSLPGGAPGITIDWMFDGGALRVETVPKTLWLSGGRLLVYDTTRAGGTHPFRNLDPATGKSVDACDAGKALASLREAAGDVAPGVLPWPDGIDAAGERAVYLFGGDVYALDFRMSRCTRLTRTPEEESSVSIAPDGNWIAFVRANDLYVEPSAGGPERRLTTDGSATTLNGRFSWVYWEEIFGHHDNAYWWSPDSRAIAFLQTDESMVSVMSFTDFEPYQPRILTQRYPKAGQKTPVVRVGFVRVEGGSPAWMDIPRASYEYVTGVDWLPGGGACAVQTMNRAQTEVALSFVRSADGRSTRVLTETDDAWLHIYHPLFLKDRREFLWIAERTGYAAAYRYTLEGKLLGRVTPGDRSLRPYGAFAIYDESPLQAVDEKGGWAYYTAGGESSAERQIYRAPIGGGTPERVSEGAGTHRPSFRGDGRYFVDRYSNAHTPPALTLYGTGGGPARVISAPRTDLIPGQALNYPSFFRIPATDGFMLPAQISTPQGFDSTKKYPLILYVYGGPGSPTVQDEWNVNGWAESIWFDQALLSAGYLVASVDNRSSSCEGKTFEKSIRGQMYGDVELNDLLSAVRYLTRLPFVDSTRVGIWGWSGGGMYTLLALTRSHEFRAGIAVAPVTDWHYYDAKWAELPMKRPEDNPAGYAHTSLVARAGDLHGRLLLVHGTDDDNVHPQNSQAFMNALIREGILFDLMVYPMRKHTIDDPPAKKHLFRTMLRFWQNNL